MAGTVTKRCENQDCRRPVMVADRDGTVGNAFGSTVTTERGAPSALCAFCQQQEYRRRSL